MGGKEQFQQKLEVKFAVVAKNLGNKKVLVEHEQGQIVLHYGEGVVSFLVQNGKKRNNILVTAIFESLVDRADTKIFCNICKGFNIDLNQKILLVVTKKTRSLKLSTQNLKNVELISASSLNTLSLLKAKHIIFTPPAMQFFSPLAMQYVQTEYS